MVDAFRSSCHRYGNNSSMRGKSARILEHTGARVDCVSKFPVMRYNDIRHYCQLHNMNVGKIANSEAAFLPKIDMFDNQLFGMTPKEAEFIGSKPQAVFANCVGRRCVMPDTVKLLYPE